MNLICACVGFRGEGCAKSEARDRGTVCKRICFCKYMQKVIYRYPCMHAFTGIHACMLYGDNYVLCAPFCTPFCYFLWLVTMYMSKIYVWRSCCDEYTNLSSLLPSDYSLYLRENGESVCEREKARMSTRTLAFVM